MYCLIWHCHVTVRSQYDLSLSLLRLLLIEHKWLLHSFISSACSQLLLVLQKKKTEIHTNTWQPWAIWEERQNWFISKGKSEKKTPTSFAGTFASVCAYINNCKKKTPLDNGDGNDGVVLMSVRKLKMLTYAWNQTKEKSSPICLNIYSNITFACMSICFNLVSS